VCFPRSVYLLNPTSTSQTFHVFKDGTRSSTIVGLAKKAKKELRLGKAGGPVVYSRVYSHLLDGLGFNKREKEALDLNFGALQVTWIQERGNC